MEAVDEVCHAGDLDEEGELIFKSVLAVVDVVGVYIPVVKSCLVIQSMAEIDE